jgi:hypothetical protein
MSLETFVTKLKSLKLADLMAQAIFDKTKGTPFQPNELVKQRLYNYGITADGVKLRTYDATYVHKHPFYCRKYTVPWKIEKNQPVNRVTLRDHGRFYKSMQFRVKGDSFYYYGIFWKQPQLFGMEPELTKHGGIKKITSEKRHIGRHFIQLYPQYEQFEQAVLTNNTDEIEQMIDLSIREFINKIATHLK